MNDWVNTTLDELGSIVTGRTPPTSNSSLYGGQVPFITPSDLDGRRVISTTIRYLSDAGVASVANARIPPKSVLVSCIGSDMGKAAIAGKDSVTNQQINSLIVKADVDYLFVYYNLSSRKSEIRGLASGSAQPILNKTAFGRLNITLPRTLAEQQKVSGILAALDDKIEINRQMNETLETMARAIFKDWFVDFGPVRAKMEGRKPPGLATDIAKLFPDKLDDEGKPEGWSIHSLGDIAESAGVSVKPSDVSDETPYIGLEHMPRRSIALDKWGKASKVTSGKLSFKKGDFLFGKLRPYFHKVGIAPINGICSTDILVLRAKKPAASALVASCISQDEFVAYTNQTSGGTKMPRTSWDLMSRYEIALSFDGIIEAFERVTQPLLDRIVSNVLESTTLASLRDLLLPKLMSGEVRLKSAENSISGAI